MAFYIEWDVGPIEGNQVYSDNGRPCPDCLEVGTGSMEGLCI